MKKGVIAVISTLLGAASGATVAGVGVAKAVSYTHLTLPTT